MKKSYIFLGFAALMVSCSQSESSSPESQADEGVVCSVAPLEEVNLNDDGETRSNLTYDASAGMVFSWEQNEKITVYSDAKNQGDFSLAYIHGNSASASFTGGNFHLINGQQYYALSKSVKAPDFYPTDGLKTDNWSNISVSYAGQRMIENGSTAHLGKCDYMAARATAEAENQAGFDFIHLGATIRVVLNNIPTGVKFKRLEIYDATDNSYRELTRTLNITNNSDATDATYAPYLNEPTITSDSKRIGVDLGPEDDPGLTASSDGTMVVYMEVPPVDFTAKSHTIGFHLIPLSDSQVAYFGTFNPKKIRGDKAYRMNVELSPADKFYVSVKINHLWEKGNTVTQTRATGDPGITEDMTPPSHLYAFFINDGHLDDYRDISAEWETADNISTLTPSLSFTSSTTSNEPRVYFIASDKAISTWKKSDGSTIDVTKKGSSGPTEAEIKDLVYNYSDYDGGTDDGLMKNLYSTPSSETDFVGALSSADAIKDVHLYHVASKVDINWKNATTTALSGKVYVSNFPTTKLSFFKPSTGNTTSATSKSSEFEITTGSAYTGRTVFYLPQPSTATYNVTVGSKTQDITFTKDNVYTSWFLGQIKIK